MTALAGAVANCLTLDLTSRNSLLNLQQPFA